MGPTGLSNHGPVVTGKRNIGTLTIENWNQIQNGELSQKSLTQNTTSKRTAYYVDDKIRHFLSLVNWLLSAPLVGWLIQSQSNKGSVVESTAQQRYVFDNAESGSSCGALLVSPSVLHHVIPCVACWGESSRLGFDMLLQGALWRCVGGCKLKARLPCFSRQRSSKMQTRYDMGRRRFTGQLCFFWCRQQTVCASLRHLEPTIPIPRITLDYACCHAKVFPNRAETCCSFWLRLFTS